MCFVHSGSAGSAGSAGLIQQASLGAQAAAAFSSVAGEGSAAGLDVAGFGTPEVVAGPGGVRTLDGYGRVLHNRWNRDLPPDRKSTRLNSSHAITSRMPSSA